MEKADDCNVVLGFDPWPYGGKPVFVLSTRDLPSPPSGAIVDRLFGGPGDMASELAARGFRHIHVDGGLIQRITVTRVPVLIGTGNSSSGLVQGEYAVAA